MFVICDGNCDVGWILAYLSQYCIRKERYWDIKNNTDSTYHITIMQRERVDKPGVREKISFDKEERTPHPKNVEKLTKRKKKEIENYGSNSEGLHPAPKKIKIEKL